MLYIFIFFVGIVFIIGESKNISLDSREVIKDANIECPDKDIAHTFEKDVIYNYNVTDDGGNIIGEENTIIRYIASFNQETYKRTTWKILQ